MNLVLGAKLSKITSLTPEQLYENIQLQCEKCAAVKSYIPTLTNNDNHISLVVVKALSNDKVLDVHYDKVSDRLNIFTPEAEVVFIIPHHIFALLPREDFVKLLAKTTISGTTYHVINEDAVLCLDVKYSAKIEQLNKMLMGERDYILTEFKRKPTDVVKEICYRLTNNDCKTFEEACRDRYAFGYTTITDTLEAIKDLYPNIEKELRVIYNDNLETKKVDALKYANKTVVDLVKLKLQSPTLYQLLGGELHEDQELAYIRRYLIENRCGTINVTNIKDPTIEFKVVLINKELADIKPCDDILEEMADIIGGELT